MLSVMHEEDEEDEDDDNKLNVDRKASVDSDEEFASLFASAVNVSDNKDGEDNESGNSVNNLDEEDDEEEKEEEGGGRRSMPSYGSHATLQVVNKAIVNLLLILLGRNKLNMYYLSL